MPLLRQAFEQQQIKRQTKLAQPKQVQRNKVVNNNEQQQPAQQVRRGTHAVPERDSPRLQTRQVARPKTATASKLNPLTQRGAVEKEAGEVKKRKKSVHFPENHVIPIDDSSYYDESEQGVAHETQS